MEDDRKADYVGIWKQIKINSSEDYNLFYLWITAGKDPFEGFSLEETPSGLAFAKISLGKIRTDLIKFTKEYSQNSKKRDTYLIRNPITYEGKIDHSGGFYFGNFNTTNSSNQTITGEFYLGKDCESIGEIFADCKIKSLDNQIVSKRKEHQYLPLKDLFD